MMWWWFDIMVLLTSAIFSLTLPDVFPSNIDLTDVPVESYVIQAGDNTSFPCPGTTEYSLVTELEWRFFTKAHFIKIIEYSKGNTIVEYKQNRISLQPKTHALNFKPIQAEDTGNYICLVNNRPRPDGVLQLIVQDRPDAPGRPLVMGFTSRYVNLSWAAPPDVHFSNVIFYVILIRVGEKGEWNDNGNITPDNRTNYKMTDLKPYTVYSFKIIAVNEMGRSDPSQESYYIITLREIPSGSPTIITAHNTSSTAIHVSWRPPDLDTINGEFMGYRITYKQRKKEQNASEIYIRDPEVKSHIIENLETYTQYLVSVAVFNPEGAGPASTVLVMTDEGVPSNPQNVIAHSVTSNSILIGWDKPEKPNGNILGYRIYYRDANNFTDVQTYKIDDNSTLSYNLTELSPDTKYEIWVKAFTDGHEGNSSITITKITDIAGPSAPVILNLTCHSSDSIFLQWRRPSEFYKNISYYNIYLTGGNKQDNISVSATKDYTEISYMLQNLTTNEIYGVQVGAATFSDYTGKFLNGSRSETKYIHLKHDCDKIQQYLQSSVSTLSVGIIAGVLCITLVFLLAITAFILWRRYFYVSYCYLEDNPCSVPTASLDWNTPPNTGEHRGPVPVSEFNKHIAELHADGDCGFSREYEAIQTDSTIEEYPSEHSQHPDNRAKNRYLNIIAYDHSRVQLLQILGHKRNIDYINANYIDGFQWSKAYIGTQGPLPSTFDCFWRMIWEQRVAIIIMITNLVERGRDMENEVKEHVKKCDMYWPKEGTDTYGLIQVKLVKEDVMATYTVRTLQIKHLKVKKRKLFSAEKTVYQYHYTNWPDHGTPDHPLPVLHFVKKSASANLPNAGPVVVHCSAGVGRTGAYIVLDAMLRQIRQRGEVNIFGFLKHIRSQRNFLVQTEEQYIFIHDALLEAIQSGETNIPKEEISRYVGAIQNEKEESSEVQQKYWKPLDYQFKLVTSFQCKDFNLVSANKSVNVSKNRCQSIVPVESSRVHLTPKPGEDGSDYINASWIQGFHSLKEFIITQHPLKETVKDFWQMVWDHNAQILVLLSAIDQECEVFWPLESESLEEDNFKVSLLNQEALSDLIVGEFSLQSLQDDYELRVRMIQCFNWPHSCSSSSEIYNLPNFVQELPLNYQNGPLVIIDKFGGTEAATFCVLTTLKKQLLFENHVDIYMYAKLYHNWRPGIWKTVDDYLKLHLAVQALCNQTENAPESYAFTNGTVNGSISSSDCVRVPPEGMEAGVSHQAVA